MKSLFKTLALTATMAFIGVQASAQSQISLNLLGSMPMGDFKKASTNFLSSESSIKPVIGNAALGAGLGLKYAYCFYDDKAGYVAPFIGFDLIWNQLNSDMRALYDAKSYTKPNYVNVPIMLGFKYKYMMGNFELLGFYAEAGVGANILYVSPEGLKGNLTKYDTSTGFAYQGGLGLCFGKKLTVGVHYYDLGKHDIKPQSSKILDSAIPSSLHENILAFRLGFDF